MEPVELSPDVVPVELSVELPELLELDAMEQFCSASRMPVQKPSWEKLDLKLLIWSKGTDTALPVELSEQTMVIPSGLIWQPVGAV